MGEMDLAIKEFLVESQENLDQLDRDLIAVEKEPTSREMLDNIFRTIHTIKGTCGFFDFPKLEAVTHAGEGLLCGLRNGRLAWNSAITGDLLELVDVVHRLLAGIERTGAEIDEDFSALVEKLERLRESGGPVAEAVSIPAGTGVAITAAAVGVSDGPQPDLGDETPSSLTSTPPILPEDSADGGRGEGTIRVDVGLLDKLMSLVGELVLARNQIFRHISSEKDSSFQNAAHRLSLITSELQEGVMRTRMQPIGNLWNRYPRIVRDLALHCGKKARIAMDGKHTGLDKTILEAIKDPLTHLIRNAIDHGIELPESRLAAGKPEEGRVFLRAYHEGGLVNIEISDDGAGIVPPKIKQKALERGLISLDQAARLDDRELMQLIFLPGFSTAEIVTNVSGRGVGMDVVKTNVEKIGGSVDLQSEPGRGTTFKVKIPLTLSIIPALIILSGGDRYAIPQVSLLELVRLEGEEACGRIEWIQGVPLYRLRGELLPLVDLDRTLGVNRPHAAAGDEPVANHRRHPGRQPPLRAARPRDHRHRGDRRQTPRPATQAHPSLLGHDDHGRRPGRADPRRIGSRPNGRHERRDREVVRARTSSAARPAAAAEAARSFLLVGLGDERRMALPLDVVARLEEIDAETVRAHRQPGGRPIPRPHPSPGPARRTVPGRHRSRGRGSRWSLPRTGGTTWGWSSTASSTSSPRRPSCKTWATGPASSARRSSSTG